MSEPQHPMDKAWATYRVARERVSQETERERRLEGETVRCQENLEKFRAELKKAEQDLDDAMGRK